MKKTLLLAGFLLMGFGYSEAQQSASPATGFKNSGVKLNKKVDFSERHENSRSTQQRWYLYGDAMDQYVRNYMLDSSSLYANNLFPDSTILVDYGTSGYAGTWIHLLADMLDVTSPIFNDPIFSSELNITRANNFTNFSIDSAEFYFIYSRGLNNPSIVDTLVFEYSVVNRPGPFSYFGPTSPVSLNLGTDTTMFFDLPYVIGSNSMGTTTAMSAIKQIKVPLTDVTAGDTLDNGLNVIQIPLDNVTGLTSAKLMVMSVKFVPGYSWIANTDTIDAKNSVRFISYKETETSFPLFNKRDFTCSYIVPQDVRYDNAGGWNGSFIPSFAYMGGATPTYDYQHHMIAYKVNAINVGVNENAAAASVAVQPNPANDYVRIALNDLNAGNVTLKITDLSGKTIQEYSSNFAAGNQNIILDVKSFNSGVYFVQLNGTNVNSTVRVCVTH